MTKFFTIWAAMLVVAAMLFSVPVAAQDSTTAPLPEFTSDMTAQEITEMVARMSDDQVRLVLMERLDAAAAEQQSSEEPVGLVARLGELWTAFATPMNAAIRTLPNVPAKQAESFQNFADRFGGSSGVIQLIGLIVFVLALGFAVERLALRFLPIREVEVASDEDGLWPTLRYLVKRFFAEVLGLMVFYAVVRLAGNLILTDDQLRYGAIFALYLVWIPRLFRALARVVLSPKRADLRLVSADDATARFLLHSLTFVVLWGGLTMVVLSFNTLNGVPGQETRIAVWMDTLVYVFLGIVIWSARDGLREILSGDDDDFTKFDQRVAQYYPIYGLVCCAVVFVLVNTLNGLGQTEQLVQGAHYTTLATLLLTPLADTAVRGLVRHLLPPMTGTGPVAEAAHEATKRSYINIGRVFVVGIALVNIAQAWGFSIADLLTETIGIGDNFFRFMMTLVVGYLVYEISSVRINQRLRAESSAAGMSQEEADNEIGGAGGSRLSTVLPLVLATSRWVIIVVFGLLAVGTLGIDITPLLAGAGIAGLAIGFGAQKLVTDVVSGVFFLVDDAFRVGEYVEIDGTMGAVEKISIRSMQLRHHRGPVHTIPYGEIPKLTNYSRDWVIMKLKFTVDFDTDPNKVKKIFKKIGQEMLEDELYKDDFLQPFKSQGVFDIDDVGMVIRGKFMAKPGKQFMIRKEIYNRVKAEFEANGVEFARREVRVAIPGGEHMTEEEQHQAVTAAAAAAAVEAANKEGEQGA